MIIEAGPDIINFDASEYMDYFLLYPEEIVNFLQKGGIIAWGIVPTANYSGEETVEMLLAKLRDGLNRVHDWGIDPEILAARSIITPACGMGTMSPELAARAMGLLSQLSERLFGEPS